MAMPHSSFQRVLPHQVLAQHRKAGVLRLGEGREFIAFQFNANRKIVAAVASLPVADPSVPSAVLGADKLCYCP